MDINALDDTEDGNPPLFHYLSHHASTVHSPLGFSRSVDFEYDNGCHVANMDDLFATADLKIKNRLGDGALHIVAINGRTLGRRATNYIKYRPNRHDAEVFRFLVSEKGLDPLMEDAKGRSSLDLAVEGRREAILEIFKQKN